MIDVLSDALDDVKLYKEKCDRYYTLSKAALKILACFKEHPEVRLSAQELITMTKLARRTVTYSLNTLNEAHFIQKYGRAAGTRYQLIF